MAPKPKIPKLSNNTLKKTGNDYATRVGKGEKITPGKGDCPANKHLKPKLKPKK